VGVDNANVCWPIQGKVDCGTSVDDMRDANPRKALNRASKASPSDGVRDGVDIQFQDSTPWKRSNHPYTLTRSRISKAMASLRATAAAFDPRECSNRG